MHKYNAFNQQGHKSNGPRNFTFSLKRRAGITEKLPPHIRSVLVTRYGIYYVNSWHAWTNGIPRFSTEAW